MKAIFILILILIAFGGVFFWGFYKEERKKRSSYISFGLTLILLGALCGTLLYGVKKFADDKEYKRIDFILEQNEVDLRRLIKEREQYSEEQFDAKLDVIGNIRDDAIKQREALDEFVQYMTLFEFFVLFALLSVGSNMLAEGLKPEYTGSQYEVPNQIYKRIGSLESTVGSVGVILVLVVIVLCFIVAFKS